MAVTLDYLPPYDFEALLQFLATRAIAGVEDVSDGVYRRTVRFRFEDRVVAGWLCVSHLPQRHALEVAVSDTLTDDLDTIVQRMGQLFDIHADPATIKRVLAEPMRSIADSDFVAGTRIAGFTDAFELCVRAVLGQQITVKAAGTLAARLVQRLGDEIATPFVSLTHLFPTPETILATDDIESVLGNLGITSARGRTIARLAQLFAEGGFVHPQDFRVVREKLLAVPGIGSWTAGYIAMRMGDKDVFLPTDAGVRHVLPGKSPKEIEHISKNFQPWRSYAVMHLWQTLSAVKE